MRKAIFILVAILATASPAILTAAEAPVRTISVSGTAETKVMPDHIVWNINLTDIHADLKQAKAENDRKIQSVFALRNQLGIAEGDLETGQVSVWRDFERDPMGQVKTGERVYFVSRRVTIRLHDLDRFDEYLDTLISSADMEVNFSFQSSKIHDVRAETRLKALKIAREKAKAMAEVVDASIGKVLTINEHPESGPSPWGRGMMASNVMYSHDSAPARPDNSTGTFAPGAITEQITVYAVFELK